MPKRPCLRDHDLAVHRAVNFAVNREAACWIDLQRRGATGGIGISNVPSSAVAVCDTPSLLVMVNSVPAVADPAEKVLPEIVSPALLRGLRASLHSACRDGGSGGVSLLVLSSLLQAVAVSAIRQQPARRGVLDFESWTPDLIVGIASDAPGRTECGSNSSSVKVARTPSGPAA